MKVLLTQVSNNIILSMRFSLIFIKKTVAEWEQCYYGYLQCKQLISLCKKGYAIKCNIEDLTHEENYSTEQSQNLMEHRQQIDQIKIQSLTRINQVIQKANCIFFRYHSLSKKLAFTFLQFKLHQLNLRLDFYKSCKDYVTQTQPYITKILANCYSESLKLQQMSRLHLQAYYKIHKKHENAYKLFGLSSPSIRTAKLDRSVLSFKTFQNRLNEIIQQRQDIVLKAKKVKFQEEFEPSPFKLSLMSYLFGLFNGFSFCVIIAAFVLLAVNLAHRSQADRPTQRLIFSNQYRLWKSTGFIILYTFINAISYYIYQKYKINYPMIFSYSNYRKVSAKRLSVSTILLLIWSCFFIFYVLDLVGIYQVARVSSNPDNPITIFFPSIIFAIFFIAIFIQFIRSSRGVLFFVISSAKMLITMLWCEQIVFGVVWATQQLISLVQLIFDFSFSFCYYAQVLQTPAVEDNPCMRLKIVPQCIAIFAFCIRIFQSIRIAVENQNFLWTRQMYRFLRSFLYIVLASISIAADTQNYAILWIWFALGMVSGFYSFAIDVFLDWGQYIYYPEINQIKKRQYNIYSKFQINLMIGFNFIARFFFIITICPCIIFAYTPDPELLISIAGLVQVCRRLVWNLMRIENEQLKNNYFFKIKTDYQRLQRKVLAEALKIKGDLKYEDSLSKERKNKQLQILREFVRQKQEMYNKVIQFCQQNNQILDSIQVHAETKIGCFVAHDDE